MNVGTTIPDHVVHVVRVALQCELPVTGARTPLCMSWASAGTNGLAGLRVREQRTAASIPGIH